MTHWTVPTFVSRSFSIVGSATHSAVKSLAMRKTPAAIAARASIVPRSIPVLLASAIGPEGMG